MHVVLSTLCYPPCHGKRPRKQVSQGLNSLPFRTFTAASPVLSDQTEDPSVVSVVDDELTLDGDCFVKV